MDASIQETEYRPTTLVDRDDPEIVEVSEIAIPSLVERGSIDEAILNTLFPKAN